MNTHELSRKTVTETIARKSIGCYRVGCFDPDGCFVPMYIGRSTRCLQSRLLDHASMSNCEAFQFEKLDTVKEVFDTECLWYHLLRDRLDNVRHPDAPRSLPYECKWCQRHPSAIHANESAKGGVL